MNFLVASVQAKSSPTSQMVAKVKEFKVNHPEKFKHIFSKIEQIILQEKKQ